MSFMKKIRKSTANAQRHQKETLNEVFIPTPMKNEEEEKKELESKFQQIRLEKERRQSLQSQGSSQRVANGNINSAVQIQLDRQREENAKNQHQQNKYYKPKDVAFNQLDSSDEERQNASDQDFMNKNNEEGGSKQSKGVLFQMKGSEERERQERENQRQGEKDTTQNDNESKQAQSVNQNQQIDEESDIGSDFGSVL